MAVTSRMYVGPRERRRPPHGVVAGLPWLLAATTVGIQIAYPLVEGPWLTRVTIATVVSFAATCVVHALVHRGALWTLGLVVVTAGGGFLAEAVGVATGRPFGTYSYAGTLGPELADVPLIVPLAWTMIAYPVLLAARRLTWSRWGVALVGGFGMMGWDLFLDPLMVGDGHWRWAFPTPALPGVEGIPLTNFAGWFAVGVAMMLVLDLLLPRDGRRSLASQRVPALLLGWTWLGYVLGNIVWFGTPSVALVGGVALGLIVLPYLGSLWLARD